jgi:hypothetical protein
MHSEIIRARGMNSEEILVENAVAQPHRTIINPLEDQTRILGQAPRDSIKQELLKSA